MNTAPALHTRATPEASSRVLNTEPGSASTLVAGLGNVLLRDDGIGVHCVRTLQQTGTEGASVAEVGTAVLDALYLIEKADRILAIDAMKAGKAPGTIYRLTVKDIANPGAGASLHELSFLSALEFVPNHNPEIVILGVEPAKIEYGMELTPPVQEAMPTLIAAVNEVLGEWGVPSRPC